MKKITLLFLFAIAVSGFSWSQCGPGPGGQYPSGTITVDAGGDLTTISTCNYSSEFSVVDGIVEGNDYSVSITLTGADLYVTVENSADNSVIAHGASPFTFTAPAGVTGVQFNWSEDAACTYVGSGCRVTSVQDMTAAANACPDPTGLAAANITDASADLSWTESGVSAVSYNVEVYATGESAANGDTAVFADAAVVATMVSATGLSASTDYDAYITTACSGTMTNSMLVGPVMFTTTAACADVADLSTDNLTYNTVDITYTAGTGNDSFLVEVYLSGESAANANTPVHTNAAATGSPESVTGLTELTGYDAYVTGFCGATATALQGPEAFTTPGIPPANDDCANAETIACAGQYIGDTTNATPEDPDPGTCGTSAGTAGAVWYTFTGANSNDAGAAMGSVGDEVTLDLSLSTFDTKIRVFEGACGALICVDGNDDGGTGTTSLLTIPTLVGTEYYVLVHGYAANSGAYTLDVSCVAPPLCTPAVIDSSTIVDTCNPDGTGTFTVDIVVSDAGDAGSVFDDGTTTYPVIVGTVVAGPYNSGDSVTIELVAVDTACSSTVGTFDFTCPQPPPVNDDIASAIAITVDEGFCDGTNTNGTNVAATDSAEAVGTCFNAGSADDDVWFTFTVPSTTASVDVSTDYTGGTLVDSEIAVYSGTSGSLVELDCSQDDGTTVLSNGFSWNSLITDLAVTSGETYYVQVAGYNANVGTFCLDVSTNQVLSTTDFENEAAFTYYPNPVKNTLTLNAQNTIEQVAMYNMLGQELLRVAPNSVDSNLDMSNLQTGTYFVKVTIANVTETIRVIKQ